MDLVVMCPHDKPTPTCCPPHRRIVMDADMWDYIEEQLSSALRDG